MSESSAATVAIIAGHCASLYREKVPCKLPSCREQAAVSRRRNTAPRSATTNAYRWRLKSGSPPENVVVGGGGNDGAQASQSSPRRCASGKMNKQSGAERGTPFERFRTPQLRDEGRTRREMTSTWARVFRTLGKVSHHCRR